LDLERIYGVAGTSRYPVELKERAVAMVRDRRRAGRGRGAIAQVARDLGVHPEALRHWLAQDDVGRRPSGERVAGSEAQKDARIGELERRVRELERANSILKAASAFFAKELDPPPPR
jgi:transposase